MSSAIVIGAGVAGLATAGLLARRGHQVTVVERNDTVGGRAGELKVDGFRFETGPSWYLMPDAFDRFYELMGTTTDRQLDLMLLDPGYRVFPEDAPAVDVPYGREAAAEFFEELEQGGGEKIREYLDSAAEVYDLALRYFLYTTFSTPASFTNKEVLSRVKDLLRYLLEPLDRFVDQRFGNTTLRQILKYPAVFLSSRPEEIPSLYHLMSHTDLTQGVRYPKGGFMSVVRSLEKLARDNGAQILLNTEVTAILSENDRATGVRTLSGELHADFVVSAGDLHHTENFLLPRKQRTYPEKHFAQSNPGLGTVLVMLGVKGELPELLHHNLMFSADWSDDFAVVYDGPQDARPLGASRSIYICKPSATEKNVAPAGHENLFVLVPVAADEALGHGDAYQPEASASVDAIADAAIEQIGQWAGIDDLSERIVVKRTLGPADFAGRYHAWSGGSIGPAHTLQQSAFFRGKNVSSKVNGLYYAGATTVPGVGVPMCLISAENVLKRLDGDTSTGPLGF